MDTLLIAITLVSVAIAIASFVSARRLRRIDQERSEARVAALAAAAETHGAGDGGWTQVAGEWQWNPRPQPRPAQAVSRPAAPVVASDFLQEKSSENFFGTVQREEPTANRLPLFAAAVLILLLGGALVFLNSGSPSDSRAETTAQVATPVSAAAPLELMSLGHLKEANVLTINGTVRNPSSGSKIEGLTAVVSLLDSKGALISTRDVPLDYRALAPGEEAPFKVSVPNPESIARYRVSFRAGTAVVPHVDRRTDTKLASAMK